MSLVRNKIATAHHDLLQISKQASTAVFSSQINLRGRTQAAPYGQVNEVDKQPLRKNSPINELDSHFAFGYKENLDPLQPRPMFSLNSVNDQNDLQKHSNDGIQRFSDAKSLFHPASDDVHEAEIPNRQNPHRPLFGHRSLFESHYDRHNYTNIVDYDSESVEIYYQNRRSQINHLAIEKSHTANDVRGSGFDNRRLEVSLIRSPRSTTMKADEAHASMLEQAASRMMMSGSNKQGQNKATRKTLLQNSILLEARSIDSMADNADCGLQSRGAAGDQQSLFTIVDQNQFEPDATARPDPSSQPIALRQQHSHISHVVEYKHDLQQQSLFGDCSLNYRARQLQAGASASRSHSALDDRPCLKASGKRQKGHGGIESKYPETQSESKLIVARKRFVGKQAHRIGKTKEHAQKSSAKRQRQLTVKTHGIQPIADKEKALTETKIRDPESYLMVNKVLSYPPEPVAFTQPQKSEQTTPQPQPREFSSYLGPVEQKVPCNKFQQTITEPEIFTMSETSRIYNLRLTMHEDIPRNKTTDIDRQNIMVRRELSDDIVEHLKSLEKEPEFDTAQCLAKHDMQTNDSIDSEMRARMVDWMIEVLTNFRCDHLTFFHAVSLMDRYFKCCDRQLNINDLHLIGVTAMLVGSKFEDVYPLKMKTVHEKIAHQKLRIEEIKASELELLRVLNYRLQGPTILDFLKIHVREVVGIQMLTREEEKKAYDWAVARNAELKLEGKAAQELRRDRFDVADVKHTALTDAEKIENLLIQKMAVYLAKMVMHQYDLCGKQPSLLSIGSLYVALKICEQLKKLKLITDEVVGRLLEVSGHTEEDILEVSQRILHLAQNFDKEYQSLTNLKEVHFKKITRLL